MRSRRSRRTPPRPARASRAASVRPARARAGAPRPRPRPAPGRTCTPAAPRAPRARASTRAGSPPPRTRGTRDCHAGARRASGTTNAGASSSDDDKPATVEEDVAAAQLGGELVAGEVALEDLPPRPVPEHALLHADGGRIGSHRGIDDHELAGDAACFVEETQAVRLFEVSVEMAREQAVEFAVLERERERLTRHERACRNPLLR